MIVECKIYQQYSLSIGLRLYNNYLNTIMSISFLNNKTVSTITIYYTVDPVDVISIHRGSDMKPRNFGVG